MKDHTTYISNILSAAKAQDLDVDRMAIAKEFATVGFPHVKDEDWKYTNPNKLIGSNPLPDLKSVEATAEIETVLEKQIIDAQNIRLVFIDGFFSSPLSNLKEINGLKLEETNFSQDETQLKDGFTLLNNAFHTSHLTISVDKNVLIEELVEIHHLYTDNKALCQSKVSICLDKNSALEVFENAIDLTSKEQLINNTTSIQIEANAQLKYYNWQDFNTTTNCIDAKNIKQERDSKYELITLSVDGQIIRNNVRSEINGEGIEANLFGLYTPHQQQHFDNTILVDHAAPNCVSNQLYKGLLYDDASAVFNGQIEVKQIAQKTNAFQSNKNLILSPTATINSKPQLMIYADDVKCSHGATSTQLDEDSLFYLQSRGLKKETAQSLLTFAFAKEVVEKISHEKVKELLAKKLAQKLDIKI